ncbi:hypothetical protein SFK304_2154 [Shigella flexneri K-304]|nr:hypothetical protein SFy_2215 [Shigella flexneri 2003036]AIL40602.1 hypothetical protein SFyv_2267 [Shigella flexneri Shi06HN006]EFS13499.1 hypothetical protein SF2457T_2441 [Shigella flexneri 2a str. 2457T]EGJ87203.1 hypothetical protein SF274771_2451 [Shigella flexneri 2747-71]EGJ89199.1 hypothetical protein SFK671_1938 [Shigella flexneri K-671]EGJ97457.1 hypothetical protein SF293071_1832 [Shigella flexneri 2930-71]EGK23745.1 hypothetical protein SFK218_2399 [Shigella flexneri K-218]EG
MNFGLLIWGRYISGLSPVTVKSDCLLFLLMALQQPDNVSAG